MESDRSSSDGMQRDKGIGGSDCMENSDDDPSPRRGKTCCGFLYIRWFEKIMEKILEEEKFIKRVLILG